MADAERSVTPEWSQVDFDDECVTLPPYSTKDDSDTPREVFFTSRMSELLKHQRNVVDALQKKYMKIIPQVFPTSEGEPLYRIYVDSEKNRNITSSAYFDQCWEQAAKKAEVLKGTHNLRVTACVERDSAGLSIQDNMNAGGWRSADSMQRYLNKSREDKRNAAKKIDEYREKNKTITRHSQK